MRMSSSMNLGLIWISAGVLCSAISNAASAGSAEYGGYVEASNRADVYSRAEGIVEEIFVVQGDYVEQGAPLLRLRHDLEVLAITSAQAELSKASALLEQAQRRVRRLEKLASTGASSGVSITDARTDLILAQAEKDLAQVSLTRAETALADTTVRAPISGYIEDPRVGIGSLVEFSSGDPPLFQIVNLRPVLIGFEHPYEIQPSEDETALQPDPVHHFSILSVDGALLADNIRRSASALWIDRQTGTIRSWIELENTNGLLRPGMAVRIRPSIDRLSDEPVQILDVPQAAKPSADF